MECRICFEGGTLISPCLCNGTIKYVHASCLDRWRHTNPTTISFRQCDQCHYTYRFTQPCSYLSLVWFHVVTTVLLYTVSCLGVGRILHTLLLHFEWTHMKTHTDLFLGIMGIGLTGFISMPYVVGIVAGMWYQYHKTATVQQLNLAVDYCILFGNLCAFTGLLFVVSDQLPRYRAYAYEER